MTQKTAYMHQIANAVALDYKPASAVAAGQIVIRGSLPTLATQSIAASVWGTTFAGGVWKVPKNSSTFVDGDNVYWNTTADPVNGTAGTGAATSSGAGAYLMGACVDPSLAGVVAGDEFVYVLTLRVVNVATVAGDMTADSITGSDSSLDIAAKAGSTSAGGAIALSGGAGDGAGNAGGACTATGGAGYAHTTGTGGVGGSASRTGGAGGTATSGTGGAGGAASSTGGAGGAASTSGTGGAGGAALRVGGVGGSTATGTGGVGGSVSSTAGAGGAATGATGTAGAGGAAVLTSGAGGAGSLGCTGGAGGAAGFTAGAGGATATGTGGAGGNIALTAGNGGTASGAGVSGAGGTVTLTAGTSSAGGGTAGKVGHIAFEGLVAQSQGAPTAKTTDATLTIAELQTKLLTGTHTAGATQTYTLPTGTNMSGGNQLATGDAFDWVLINLSAAAADTVTVAANTDHTVVGNMVVQSAHASTGALYGNSAQFRSRKTAATTWVTYRIG